MQSGAGRCQYKGSLDVAGGEIRHFCAPAPQDGTLPQDLVSTRARGPVVAGAQAEGSAPQRGAVQFRQPDHPAPHRAAHRNIHYTLHEWLPHLS